MRVLYEDNHLLCVEKPVNMPVQADASGDADLLSTAKEYVKEKYNKPGAVYLGLVHRLDRPVGGAMVFARTSKAADRLTSAMKRGAFEKTYLAVVCGKPPKMGEIKSWLLKDENTFSTIVTTDNTPNAKFAKLSYERLATDGVLSLLRVRLYTGRHHQIRVQLMSEGFPLWGDMRYNTGAKAGQQLALWAFSLAFPHPVGNARVSLTCPPPTVEPWNRFKNSLIDWLVPVVYEDEKYVAVDKPKGMEVAAEPEDDAVIHSFLENVDNSSDQKDLSHIVQKKYKNALPCHRIDAMTSGLVLFAKGEKNRDEMLSLMKNRQVRKFYTATVKGVFDPPEGTLCDFLTKDAKQSKVTVTKEQVAGSKEIVTKYRTVSKHDELSEIEVELITGRTHQIRAHMAFYGHPLLGDDKYGDRELNKKYGKTSQELRAVRLCFGQTDIRL